jgi:hypothetical protein
MLMLLEYRCCSARLVHCPEPRIRFAGITLALAFNDPVNHQLQRESDLLTCTWFCACSCLVNGREIKVSGLNSKAGV